MCVCDVDPHSGFKFFQNSIGDVGNSLFNPVDCYNPSFPKVWGTQTTHLHNHGTCVRYSVRQRTEDHDDCHSQKNQFSCILQEFKLFLLILDIRD